MIEGLKSTLDRLRSLRKSCLSLYILQQVHQLEGQRFLVSNTKMEKTVGLRGVYSLIEGWSYLSPYTIRDTVLARGLRLSIDMYLEK